MSDVPVTVIAHFEIQNAEGYRLYEKGFFPILKRFNGEFVTYDDSSVLFEGEGPDESRVVMFRFPSEAVARAWHADPEYQALAKHRIANTRMLALRMVRGMPARG